MTKDELIAELQDMLISAMDAADRVQEAADQTPAFKAPNKAGCQRPGGDSR